MATLASHQDSEGKNLLHEATQAVVLDDDVRFFMSLLRMKFPLYGEDVNLDFAAFQVCNVRNEDTFQNCLNALI